MVFACVNRHDMHTTVGGHYWELWLQATISYNTLHSILVLALVNIMALVHCLNICSPGWTDWLHVCVQRSFQRMNDWLISIDTYITLGLLQHTIIVNMYDRPALKPRLLFHFIVTSDGHLTVVSGQAASLRNKALDFFPPGLPARGILLAIKQGLKDHGSVNTKLAA